MWEKNKEISCTNPVGLRSTPSLSYKLQNTPTYAVHFIQPASCLTAQVPMKVKHPFASSNFTLQTYYKYKDHFKRTTRSIAYCEAMRPVHKFRLIEHHRMAHTSAELYWIHQIDDDVPSCWAKIISARKCIVQTLECANLLRHPWQESILLDVVLKSSNFA